MDAFWAKFREAQDQGSMETFDDWFKNLTGHKINWDTKNAGPYNTVDFETESELLQFRLTHL